MIKAQKNAVVCLEIVRLESAGNGKLLLFTAENFFCKIKNFLAAANYNVRVYICNFFAKHLKNFFVLQIVI